LNILESLLQSHQYLVADGAMGTALMNLGLEQGDPPESWNMLHPDRVRLVHRRYIEAGSDIILTNSFGGTRFRLELHNLQDRIHELNYAAAQLARAEADAVDRPIVVAGSMGPSGEILYPLGTCSFEEARAGFAEQAAALTEGGVDVLWIETMSDLNEVSAAAEGARSASSLPLVITMTFDTNGHTMMGVSPAQALETLSQFKPIALGGNCGNGVAEIEGVIQKMYAANSAAVLVAKPNAGIPELIDGVVTYNAGPQEMADHAVRVRNFGATIIGGCCGSTPDHIRQMVESLKKAKIERVTIAPDAQNGQPKRAEQRVRRRRRSRTAG